LLPISAQALEVMLTGDSYVSETYPTTPNPTDALLHVRGVTGQACKAWFLFKLASVLPDNRTWDQVAKATLRFYVPTVTTSGSVQVKAAKLGSGAVPADMVEENITYTQLSGHPDVYQTESIPTGGKYYSLDVTELVRDWLDSTVVNYGFVLVPGDSTVHFQIESKESTQTSHPASLHIVFVPRVPAAGDVSMGTFTNGPQP